MSGTTLGLSLMSGTVLVLQDCQGPPWDYRSYQGPYYDCQNVRDHIGTTTAHIRDRLMIDRMSGPGLLLLISQTVL